jgi:hypothetical protein
MVPFFRTQQSIMPLPAISNFLQLFLCACILMLATGCSMVRVGYGQVDTLAVWMAHDYFDLEPVQRDDFSRRFEKLHAWHRRDQLPEYVQFLAETKIRAQRGISATDIRWLIDGMKSRYALIAVRAAPDAADLLSGLSDTQIDHLRREIGRMNEKFLKENRTLESLSVRRQRQQRTALAQIRDWVGPLSSGQESRIITLLQQVPLSDALRHEDRQRRQREFLTLLETRNADRKQFNQRVRDWLLNWESNRPPELARSFEESWIKRADFYAAVDKMLTTEQRSHLTHRIQDYIDDLRYLAAQKTAASRND